MNNTLTDEEMWNLPGLVLTGALEHIKEVEEFIGGESVLLSDVNEALARAKELKNE